MSGLKHEEFNIGDAVTLDAVVCEPGARDSLKYCVAWTSRSGFRRENVSFQLKSFWPSAMDPEIRKRIEAAYATRCAKHGTQPFASSHEMLGVLLEEFDEVKDAVRANASSSIDDEVMDLLVVCLHWLTAKEPRP